MEFRPCIDIHDGKVKQIVGGSLLESSKDRISNVKENFVSEVDSTFYAKLYESRNIRGGHVIMLNSKTSPLYEQTKMQAIAALKAYPGGLMVGGGIDPTNAAEFLDAGASHVIVTSYVFNNGIIDYQALDKMVECVGKDKLVLDLSCRKKDDKYMIVTDRWQKFTDVELKSSTLSYLMDYCDEYLIHAVDVEGKASGIDVLLMGILGTWDYKPITYAGGIHSFGDLSLVKSLGANHVHATIGSALDIFGGNMKLDDVIEFCK